MLFVALFNAVFVCSMPIFLPLMPANAIFFHALHHMHLHHAQCFSSVGFPKFVFTTVFLMIGLCAFRKKST